MDPKHLRRLSLETDEQHREAMRTIDDDLREVHLGTSDPALAASRRGFLRRAMSSSTVVAFGTAGFTLPVLLGTGTAAAQSNAGNTGGTGGTAPPGTSAGPTTTVEPNSVLPDAELELLRFAESVERAAVAGYDTVTETRLFVPEVQELLRLFSRHHLEHANALQGIIEGDKRGAELYEKVAAPANQALMVELGDRVREANAQTNRDQASRDALRVVYDLEESAAATYLLALGLLDTQSVGAAAASILPVESQHAVVLGQVLELPVRTYLPAFQRDAEALSPAAYAAD